MNNGITMIIPVYNNYGTLTKLFHSIKAQIYKNFKVILVDGGSTDGSVSLCEEQIRKDKRFFLIKSKKLTNRHDASTLRNIGIENVKTKYVTFVDSDDWIDEDHLDNLFNNVEGTELCVCGWTHSEVKVHIQYNNSNILDRDEILVKTLGMKESAGYVFNKLFLTKIIIENNIRFNSNYKISEDLLFCIEYITKIKHGVILKSANTYHYIKREGSITTTAYLRNPFIELNSIRLMHSSLVGCSKRVRKAYLVHKLMAYNTVFRIKNEVNVPSSFIDTARKEIIENIFLVFSSKEYALKSRVILICFALFPNAVTRYRILKRKFL